MRDIVLGETIYMDFTTRAFATGIPTVLAGTPVLSVLEENNATPITAGVSVSVDRASVVGLNMATIVATGGNGYESGKGYSIYISTGTVGGVSVVGEKVGEFTIDASAAAQDLANGTDGLTALKTGIDAIPTTPMRGTDDAALATALTTAQNDLDTITGADGALIDSTNQADLVDDVWDEVLTGGTHNVNFSSGKRLRELQETGAVYNGEVHVDTNNGTAGTEPYVNGTSDNAVLTWADAIVIAPNVNGGLSDYHIINGSSITFTASMANQSLFGDNYVVVLGGQDCADVYVQGASISGIGTASTGQMHFNGCDFGITSIQSGHFDFCQFADTITHTLAGDYQYHNCYSGIAGPGASIFTKTPGQTISVAWRNWRDSLTVSNIESGDTFTINGTLGTVTLNGADGTVEIRGTYKSIVDNRTGSPTLNIDGAILGGDVADILDDTGTSGVELTANAVDDIWDEVLSMAAHNVGQSAAKLLRQGSDLVQIDGAVSDVSPSVTGFDTNLTQVDEYFEDSVLIFSNGAANAGIGRPVVTYLNTNGAMTFLAPDDWPVTPVNGDDFVIYATHIHPISQIQDAIVTGGPIDTTGGAVDNVTTTASNDDMRGTDGANTTAPDNAGIAAIQAQTDSLNFTIAGVVDCNIQNVNDVEVSGTGANGDEWGPV